MDKLFLMLFMIPVVGYVIYRMWIYDWVQWEYDVRDMGDDIW